ncbi:MAG: SDR family oxidoreductase [Bdellovibrionales bacterium]|nr:SDR family oxidoreductase [Bdellovibrionales bacterium]
MFSAETLQGKHIVVTGGGSGLGLEMARGFLSVGASVSLIGRNRARLEQALKDLGGDGTRVLLHPCDVRSYEEVQNTFSSIVEHTGRVDGVVNNAAGNFYCASEDLTSNGFRTVVDIVLQGTFNWSQVFGSYLIEHSLPGSILNIVATYSHFGSAFVLPSACAKAGVHALTQTLGVEWAHHGIRVNAVAPGPFPTEGAWSRLIPDEKIEQRYKRLLPTRRFGEKSELANLAIFLLSDLSPYITGECIYIDGGEHLRGGSFNFLLEYFEPEDLKKMFRGLKSKSQAQK